MTKFQSELSELIGFSKNKYMDSGIKTLNARISEIKKKMSIMRAALVRSHEIKQVEVDEYIKLNDKLLDLKSKEASMTYLRNKL